jgi:hypothetical protein
LINELIVSTLKPLNIPIAFMTYEGMEKNYIVFSVSDESETFFADDESDLEVYYVDLNYWSTNLQKQREIKELMKQNGFDFAGSQDMYEPNRYGKKFRFIYNEFN